MCPLRIILIFLSATLAGFFVLRNLKSQDSISVQPQTTTNSDDPKIPQNSSKVGAIAKGFWIFVDMATGKYLWRNLVSSPNEVSGTKRSE